MTPTPGLVAGMTRPPYTPGRVVAGGTDGGTDVRATPLGGVAGLPGGVPARLTGLLDPVAWRIACEPVARIGCVGTGLDGVLAGRAPDAPCGGDEVGVRAIGTCAVDGRGMLGAGGGVVGRLATCRIGFAPVVRGGLTVGRASASCAARRDRNTSFASRCTSGDIRPNRAGWNCLVNARNAWRMSAAVALPISPRAS